ncbi:hypothetical protein NQ318_005427 [Aromia moschata]|uniref:Transposase n=1 Tax=Aromia moschata TaxID=1265417 RepID=A0AAV8YXT5_9CUCU|nr:hypothetical protein NQ318_005427 [Aromia moschata]
MGKTQVYEWLARFKNGDMLIVDKPRSGRPSPARNDKNVEKIRELVLTETIDQLSEISGLSWSSVQRILTGDLGMKRVAAKFVPRALTDNQKECRVETCRALKQQLETDPGFLSKEFHGHHWKGHVLNFKNMSLSNFSVTNSISYEALKSDVSGVVFSVETG